MPIIETLYQLTETDTAKVSALWKGLQILGYAVASITAFIAIITFYYVLSGFSMNCILRTDIAFKALKPNDKNYELISNGINVTIDTLMTTWNRDLVCQYCILVWTMSFLGSLILGTFFILNPKGGRGHPHSIFSHPWKMVIPVLLVSILMVGLTSVATAKAIRGINYFCAGFQNYTGNESCNAKIDIFTLKFHDEVQPINKLQKWVKGCSLLTFLAWTYCVVLLFVRLCLGPDFNLQIINMIPSERKSSEVARTRIYSEVSEVTLPFFPTAQIVQLPLTTDTNRTNDSKDAESRNSMGFVPVDESRNNQQSAPNKKDDSSKEPVSPGNHTDANTSSPSTNNGEQPSSDPIESIHVNEFRNNQQSAPNKDDSSKEPVSPGNDIDANTSSPSTNNGEEPSSSPIESIHVDQSRNNQQSAPNKEDDSSKEPASPASNTVPNSSSPSTNNAQEPSISAENIKNAFFKML